MQGQMFALLHQAKGVHEWEIDERERWTTPEGFSRAREAAHCITGIKGLWNIHRKRGSGTQSKPYNMYMCDCGYRAASITTLMLTHHLIFIFATFQFREPWIWSQPDFEVYRQTANLLVKLLVQNTAGPNNTILTNGNCVATLNSSP